MDEKNLVMSPLADPVISAIFVDAEKAGLAAESLLRAVLADGKGVEKIKLGKIISVTPQRVHGSIGERGCRVDIEIRTDENEYYIFEIQIYTDSRIFQRDLFSSARIFTETSTPGTTGAEMAAKMPKVIVINILNYTIRDTQSDVVQPAKVIYEKPPFEVAMPEFAVYNVQLSRFREIEPDWNNELHYWLYALNEAHTKNKSLKEVLEMTSTLQEYASLDAGFKQFCERYDMVSGDTVSRKEYLDWYSELLRMTGMMEAAEMKGEARGEARGKAEGKAEGEARGKAEGRAEERRQNILMLKKSGRMTNEEIADAFSMSVDEVENI